MGRLVLKFMEIQMSALKEFMEVQMSVKESLWEDQISVLKFLGSTDKVYWKFKVTNEAMSFEKFKSTFVLSSRKGLVS